MTELRIETDLDFETERLAKDVLDSCFSVHGEMGPGLLEKVYLVVAGKITTEIKSVERDMDVHRAQLLSYLKLSGARLGFLVNFNSTLMKEGIKRVVL